MDTHELPTPDGSDAMNEAPPPEMRATQAAAGLQREPILEPLVALDFTVHASMRYHAKRRAWFDGLHRSAMVVVALGSAAAATAIPGGPIDTAAALTIAVAVAAALELFFAFADRARSADMLYRRFNALATEIAETNTVDDETLRRWDKRRLLIRADCEERLLVLHRICYNLEAEARGYADDVLYEIKSWQRLAAPLVSLPPYPPRRLAA
jgi:hypothetical protein